MGDVVGDWLERNSARVGAVGALLGLAGSLVSVVVAAAALVSKHRLIALGLVVVAAVLFVLTWPRLRRRAWRASTQERLAQAEQQQRSRLIDSVFAWRIEQGLEASLRRVARVRVGLAHDPRLVQAEFGTDVTAPGVELSVQEAFERGQGRLLIAGEPGSGKTTLALELMRHLLEQARIDPTAGVPELFSLASWVRRPQPIVGWLEDELRQR